MKKFSPITWLVVVFSALAIFYSLIIPLFEGPDEDDHFRFAKFLADQRALPVQEFTSGGGIAGHQGWQPPLYYTLAAILISPIDTSDFSQHLVRNEQATVVGDPTCCGRNLYFHFDDENFPFTRIALAVHLARLLSVLFGAITVAATYAIAKSITIYQLPISQSLNFHIPLASAAILAFNPSFLFASALVSNDTALAAFASLTLLIWVKLITGELAFDLKSSAMLGAILGLGVLAKTTALALIPLTLLLFLVLAWRQHNFRVFVLSFAFCSFVIAVFTSWWFARNYILYGDPLAARLVAASALFPRAGELTLLEFFQISLPQFWTTFWGGPTPSDFSPLILVALAVLTALGFIGIIFYALRLTSHVSRLTFYFLLFWLGLLFLALIQFVRTTQGGDQGRYLFPAISVFAIFFVLGLNELVSRLTPHASRFLSLSLVIGSFVIGASVPFAYTLPAYARPAMLSQNDLARFPDAARMNFANQIILLGNEPPARSTQPGETLSVALYWQAFAPMPDSYRVFVHLVGPGNRVAGGVDAIPARGAFPTLYWKPGNAIKDTYYLPITSNAQPGKYSIQVGLYPVGKPGARLKNLDSGDDRAIIGSVKIAPRVLPSYAPTTRVNANFADQIELLGYDMDGTRLILYWRARTTMTSDYKIFVHALDASGKIIAQVDREPQDGNYPTSIWDADEQVRDEYALNVPQKNFRIELGLYRADTGERLPLSDGPDHLSFDVSQ